MANDFDFDKFVEEIKTKVDLVEIIEATSAYRFETRRVGRFIKCKHPDSFMVDPDWGIYTMFAKAGDGSHQHETGDVFHWLERYANMSFWEAAQFLAQRCGVKVPEQARKIDPEKEKQTKTRLEMYEIACKWFEAELWNSPAALEYCRGRGWTDETIRAARLGFASGTERINDLRGTFAMHDVNLDDAATVSIVGKRGAVASWLQVAEIKDYSVDWVDNNYIPGLATGIRLVFPHIWRGRVAYFSARNLEMRDGKLVNRPERDENGNHRPKSHNLPRCLVGERLRYYNFAFTRGAENCLVVEGQPDAISAAQLGIGAVALAGVAADADLAALIKQHKIKRVFMGLDNDPAGQANQVKGAALFGPMTRLVTWPLENDTTQANDEVIDDNSTENRPE
jgi:DNA primase